MKIKILTANIALGVPAKGLWGIRAIMAFHSWKSVPYLLLRGNTLWGLIKYNAPAQKKGRFNFFSKHSRLDNTYGLINKYQPDIVILNEVLLQIHKDELKSKLQQLGFEHIEWGTAKHYEDVTIATIVASKLPCVGLAVLMQQEYEISGGAGIAGIRLKTLPLSIVGCHLTYGRKKLSSQQIRDLAKALHNEKLIGNDIVAAGDFNEKEPLINEVNAFKRLGILSVTKTPTCPVNFPVWLRSTFDHIFIPSKWRAAQTEYVDFGSDHMAVCTTVDTDY